MNVPFSPSELVMQYLRDSIANTDIPDSRIVVGPLTDAQQQAGGISIVEAGMPKREKYVPVVWVRLQFRCIGGTMDTADAIAHHVWDHLHDKSRLEMTQPSTGTRFLVHYMDVSGGPSMHFDSPETWENLMFAELMVGLDPIT